MGHGIEGFLSNVLDVVERQAKWLTDAQNDLANNINIGILTRNQTLTRITYKGERGCGEQCRQFRN